MAPARLPLRPPKPLRGYVVKTGDARGAKKQSLLQGVETWVTLPEYRWPKNWRKKLWRPFVRLVLALYGHAGAGGFWVVTLGSLKSGLDYIGTKKLSRY